MTITCVSECGIELHPRVSLAISLRRAPVSTASTRGSVVRTRSLTRDVILKFVSIFSEIVEQSDQRAEAAGPEFLHPRARKPRHLL
jgi:hypothetical protein